MHFKGHIITKKLPTESELSNILEKYRENFDTKEFAWDWWQIGGRYGSKIKINFNHKVLYVDGGYFKDMIDFKIDDCYVVIDDEENLYVRESWNGEDWIKHEDFEDKIKNIDLTDKFITIIDFHD